MLTSQGRSSLNQGDVWANIAADPEAYKQRLQQLSDLEETAREIHLKAVKESAEKIAAAETEAANKVSRAEAQAQLILGQANTEAEGIKNRAQGILADAKAAQVNADSASAVNQATAAKLAEDEQRIGDADAKVQSAENAALNVRAEWLDKIKRTAEIWS